MRFILTIDLRCHNIETICDPVERVINGIRKKYNKKNESWGWWTGGGSSKWDSCVLPADKASAILQEVKESLTALRIKFFIEEVSDEGSPDGWGWDCLP